MSFFDQMKKKASDSIKVDAPKEDIKIETPAKVEAAIKPEKVAEVVKEVTPEPTKETPAKV